MLKPARLDLTGNKFLVVEDDPDNRDLLMFVLQEEGAEVITAESAECALELLEQSQPDIILCDLTLPDRDGYSLIKQWRKREVELGLSPIPALALTGSVREQDQQRVCEAGFQLHVAKPFDIDQLLQIIAAVMAGNLKEFQYCEPFSLSKELSA